MLSTAYSRDQVRARKWVRRICALAFALPLLYAQDPAKLTGVRFWSAVDTTRVAIETSEEITYKYDRLADPPRVYVDLYETRPASGRALQTVAVGDGIIRQIRSALTQKEVTRVVMDLEGDVEVSASQLSNPFRVMIELRRSGGGGQAAIIRREPLRAPAEPVVTRPAEVVVLAKATRIFRPPVSRPHSPEPVFLLANQGTLPAVPVTRRARLPFYLDYNTVVPAKPAPLTATVEKEEAVPASARREPARTAEVLAAKPAERNRNGSRSLTRVLGLKLGKVVLDAGHGGHDTGTITKGGLVEKELVLDVTRRLGRMIEDRLGAEVVYTRKDDTFIPLEERTDIANQYRADLFLSIHANSSQMRSVAGFETFYLNLTNSRADMEVAARENAAAKKSIHELSDLVRRIALQDKAEESRDFAASVQKAGHALASRTHGRIRDRGVKKAPFIVLIGTKMPSVLAEIGFMSNAREEVLLKKADHREKVAEALLKGIEEYAESLSSFRVARAK
jgi:N-acetylmuramoyl-L-alanine amidase